MRRPFCASTERRYIWTAAQSYDQDILNDWSSDNPDRLAQFQQQIRLNADNSKMVIAAAGESIVGFGEVSLKTQEVKAVYVLPSAGRQGIGKQLLKHLEKFARESGLKDLWLDSSLNAETFYAANGFVLDAHGEHTLRSGRTMQCIKMRKTL